jgi:hypothetical protein
MMTVVRTSETSVYFENTRRYIPDGCHLYILHNRRRKNLKSYLTWLIEETTEKEVEHYNISVSMIFQIFRLAATWTYEWWRHRRVDTFRKKMFHVSCTLLNILGKINEGGWKARDLYHTKRENRYKAFVSILQTNVLHYLGNICVGERIILKRFIKSYE